MLASLSWEEGPCGAGTQTSEVGAGAGVWSREGQHEAGSASIRKQQTGFNGSFGKELLLTG